MSRFSNKLLPALAVATTLGSILGGCSDIYFDRRDTVSFAAGDALHTAQAVQTIDPWPAASADRAIRVDGDVVAAGVERYRTGKVIPPKGNGTSSAGYASQAPQQAAAGSTAPSAPPK
jgi:hypothetical protein